MGFCSGCCSLELSKEISADLFLLSFKDQFNARDNLLLLRCSLKIITQRGRDVTVNRYLRTSNAQYEDVILTQYTI